MSTLTDIKKRISELEGGAFQEICNALLSSSGYDGINAFGSHSESMKTTIGNPDTYFKDHSGKYIFVAYTTQKNSLFSKAKKDIEKCLDFSVTGVDTKDISEIIFCHSSSNLSPSDDKNLTDICSKERILLNIYGIDRIADEIYRYHKILSKDFLGLSIDTNQIMDYKTFIEKNDANEMAAPLSTIFQFREIEYKQMITSFLTEKVLVVMGQSGVGKSRISLEVARAFSEENGYRLLCIRSMDQPIVDDLASYIERPGKYLLFIDDANELIGFKSVLDYLTYSHNGYDVRIIATTRDYTAKKVIDQIREYTRPNVHKLTRLTDDEIKLFLDINMEIRNSDYVDKIIKISAGSPRIAYMAGRLAKLSENLDSINDATELYETYFSKVITDSQILTDRNLCICAGIVSLLHTINMSDLSCLDNLLEKYSISTEEFKINLYRLFEMEYIDIQLDNIVIMSDQCLGNYLLLFCFFKKRYIKFSDILEDGFRYYRNGVIKATDILWNIFSSAEVHKHIESEINVVWELFENESENLFCDFVKVYHNFKPVDALIFVKNRIDLIEEKDVDVHQIDFKKNNFGSSNEILELLSGYRYQDNMQSAIELICDYVDKRHDVCKDAYETIIRKVV